MCPWHSVLGAVAYCRDGSIPDPANRRLTAPGAGLMSMPRMVSARQLPPQFVGSHVFDGYMCMEPYECSPPQEPVSVSMPSIASARELPPHSRRRPPPPLQPGSAHFRFQTSNCTLHIEYDWVHTKHAGPVPTMQVTANTVLARRMHQRSNRAQGTGTKSGARSDDPSSTCSFCRWEDGM